MTKKNLPAVKTKAQEIVMAEQAKMANELMRDDYVVTTYVGGAKKSKNVPSSAKVNFMARTLDRNIQGPDIVSVWDNEEGCGVTVRCWIGDKSKPIQEASDTVTFNYTNMLQEIIINACTNGIYVHAKGGKVKPTLTWNGMIPVINDDDAVKQSIMKLFLQKKVFATREATSKATRRCQLKLMGYEYRDKVEIDGEIKETQQVTESKGGTLGLPAGTDTDDGKIGDPNHLKCGESSKTRFDVEEESSSATIAELQNLFKEKKFEAQAIPNVIKSFTGGRTNEILELTPEDRNLLRDRLNKQ